MAKMAQRSRNSNNGGSNQIMKTMAESKYRRKQHENINTSNSVIAAKRKINGVNVAAAAAA